MYNPQYKDLIRLINYQRDKLSNQQAELTKYDAEIMFWEGKTREQQHQMDFMAQEATRIEATGRHTEEQVYLNFLFYLVRINYLLHSFYLIVEAHWPSRRRK